MASDTRRIYMFMTISAALHHYLQDVYISHLFVGMKAVHLNTTKCGFERWLRLFHWIRN